ncbi:alanine racemase [Paenibacillus sp. GCM10023252]|uniref:alanine racemase n=1 Tax=Paenibacillus sp. GCM10023252 TaxID=3252649 RepID=UPI003608488B
MDSYYRPTRAEISLDALHHNIKAFRQAMPETMLLMASVKANAYGHGAVMIAKEAAICGVDYLGVAFLDEALQLRNAGIDTPILVLGFVPPSALILAREQNITIALFREDVLEAAALLPDDPQGRRLKVHIKVDTGMGRLGLIAGPEAVQFIERACGVAHLEVEGLFSHYARADEEDKAYTKLQYERYTAVVEEVRARQLHIPIIHAANSAAGIDTPEWGGGMLRLGISMYGIYPSAEVNHERVALQPVLSLKTEVVMVKNAPEGWGISYGTRYTAEDQEKIGTLPIGYADGYSRMLTGKAQALVRGVRVPVRGTICMDQCMLGLNEADSVADPIGTGEEVVLLGKQGSQWITAEEIADQLGTINYEVTCMLAARVPRVYVSEGRTVHISNPIL